MSLRTIKHGVFLYHNPETHIVEGQEKTILVERQAFHNTTVDIPREEDLERGEQIDAFWTEDQARAHYAELGVPAPGLVGGAATVVVPADVAASEEEVEVDLADLETDGLVDWLTGTGQFDGHPRPNAATVVEAAADDPALAERLTEAEKIASGDAPRKSVLEGLSKVTTAA